MSGEDTVTSLASTLKLSKENFVSNHSGTNLAELCILFAVVPCVTFLLQLHGSPCQPGLLCPVSQSACIVLPTVLAVVSNNLIWAWLLIVLVLVSVSVGWSSLPHTVAITRSLQHLAEQPTKSYITSVRGTTLLCTAICILAVDFHAFPRRFCKAEKFGQGLMDIGVGAFVFSSGISSRPAPLTRPYKGIVRNLERNGVLLILGLIRLCSVKTLEYQEHASEYGVHWNFFLTVAAVSTVMALVPIPRSHAIEAGSVVLVGHQLALNCGLMEVIHADVRGPQLWHLNKEGLLSLPGYWALSLLSVGLSSYLHPEYGRPDQEGAQVSDRYVWLWFRKLLAIIALLWAALSGALQWVQPVSKVL
ncbi:hypothetical protein ABBQ32_001922 [Trebouxia sp. C0010 RCD-2024]